jgi:surface protein
MDKFIKASEGKSESQGGMNVDQIKKHLLSLPGADKKKINVSSRPELNKLLFNSLNNAKVATPKVATPKVVTPKVVTPKIVYDTFEDLKWDLGNTILPLELTNIVLKYTETILRLEFDDTQILYFSQSEFNDLHYRSVITIDSYGVLVMTDYESKFSNSIIKSITGPVILIGDTTDKFSQAKNFNSDISNWDTSKVTNMGGMFNNAINFNSDISNWDTSKVTDMGGMFNNAKNFNKDISRWDTSKVTDMGYMFHDATNFNSDISDWDTSKVINMEGMFYNATNFNQDLSLWNTSKVKHIKYMFKNAINFKGIAEKSDGVWRIIYYHFN